MSDPTVVNIQQIFNAAVAHHQAGRLGQAEPLYRQVLSMQPNHPDVLHLLGVLYHQAGHADAAIACYRRVVELKPDFPDAHGNLGQLLIDVDRVDEAVRHCLRATQLAPQRAEYHVRLCLARQRQGDPHGAVLAGRRAVELAPQMPEAWSNLAVSLASVKKIDEAMEAANRALAMAPDRPEALVNLGFVHQRAERPAEAEAAFRKAIEVGPNYSVAHRNLAALLDGENRIEESAASLERALALQPRDIEGWNNLSTLRRKNRDIAGALAAANKALELGPGHPGAHGNIGLALLAMGDYEKGFPEYEWRWRCDNFTTAPRDFDKPMWDGTDPAGRTIFVHAEQGYGDTIQFVRYVPMLAAQGAKVILEATVPLRALLSSVKGVSKIVVAGVRPPEFDLHIPLLSLPKIFKTTLQTVPAEVPYLFPDPARLEKWKPKTAAPAGHVKVGLVWAGNVKPDANRTCPFEMLAALATVPEVAFFSLQKGDDAKDALNPPAGMNLVSLSDNLQDFADTAAAMTHMDLILTIDTAAAHLAGALGRPTWALLPWACDWRWLDDREDSPWYPTMRLIRQPKRGDWPSVIARVAADLAKFPRG
ncbi:MAG TPA: tetratricopeptide repeat protein [Tepidisphaeraceae bacterium]|jgi:Flp pilus assembly protein TadD